MGGRTWKYWASSGPVFSVYDITVTYVATWVFLVSGKKKVMKNTALDKRVQYFFCLFNNFLKKEDDLGIM